MATAAETKTLSSKAVRFGSALVSLVAACVVALVICFAYFTAPIPGNRCHAQHATAEDASGRTLACDPKTIGSRELVWQ